MKKWIIAVCFIFCEVAAGAQDRPQQTRVSLQFIEVAHTSLTEMLASDEKNGETLYGKTIVLTKNGQATILESCMVVTRSGQRANTESIREEIFPSQYGSMDLLNNFVGNDTFSPNQVTSPIFRQIFTFEPRNTGVTLEVEATVAPHGMISIRVAPEIVTRLRLVNYMEHVDPWGDASYRMPIFECLRAISSITVKPGKFVFISALTPKMNGQGPVVMRKILVFIRADLLIPRRSN